MLTRKNVAAASRTPGRSHRDQVRLRGAREPGREVEHEPGRGDRDRVLEEVERDLLQRLAADRVREDVGEAERDEAGQRAGDEHRRERERGRGRDLALRAAREHLQRDELTDEGEQEEHDRLRGEEATKIARAIDHEPDGAQHADRDNGGDVGVERAESDGAGDHRARYCGCRGRRLIGAPELPLTAVTDLHADLAPLGAGAETLEENGHDTRDEREPVETCLHHGSDDLRVMAPPLRAFPTRVVGRVWT